MSGSPVYAMEKGAWMPDGKTDISDLTFGKAHDFLGVYSGRIHAEDEFKAQLGLVWKAAAVEEIIEGDCTGISSFELTPSEFLKD
jgi:hypothetical protein